MIVFSIIMAIIAASGFASHVYVVGFLALGLTLVGTFIHIFYDDPVVRGWVERWF